MVSNRSYYALLTLCLFGCGKSAAVKDDSSKTPALGEIVSPEATDEPETEESELTEFGPLPSNSNLKPYEGPNFRPRGR